MTNASITVGRGKKTAIIKEQNPQGQRKTKIEINNEKRFGG
jgi:hypothetical protein